LLEFPTSPKQLEVGIHRIGPNLSLSLEIFLLKYCDINYDIEKRAAQQNIVQPSKFSNINKTIFSKE
jgi:hypothetical protein